jgi:hypothetical protein
VFDPNTRQTVFSNKPEPKPPVPGSKEDILNRFARERGKKIEDLTTTELGQAERAANPIAAPKDDRIVQVMGPDGVPVWAKESEAVGKPAAQAARAVTGAERQSLAYFNRAKEAVDTVTNLEGELGKMNVAGQTYALNAPNMINTQLGQSYRQAQRAFTEARLRKESGAAIPNTEFANDAKTYFAQPGDTAETLEQKRKARATVLEGLGYSAGKAYDEFTASR